MLVSNSATGRLGGQYVGEGGGGGGGAVWSV